MLLDNQGDVVNNITYDAFGNITLETHPEVNFRFSYTGRELDEETGLYNYRSRYYDPAVGEFISEDTIGFAGGDANLSRYVTNSPVNYTDPFGFCSGGQQWILGGPPPTSAPDLNFDFLEDHTFEIAGALDAGSLLDESPVENDEDGDSYPDYYKPKLIDGFGAAGLGLGLWWNNTHSEFTQTVDGSTKFTTPINKIIGGFKDLWNELFNPNNINLGTYDPKVDPFNVETFPGKNYSDDFSNRDIFTFPDAENIKVKDYIETFPKGVDHWLESPFFDSSNSSSFNNELGQLYNGGNTPTASDVIRLAEDSGFTLNQNSTGPRKYVDENGVTRITVKEGSSRAPGSNSPHIEIRDASGQRVDINGNPVTRKSLGNHTPIQWDL
jgi:RHS repeat-associated protein